MIIFCDFQMQDIQIRGTNKDQKRIKMAISFQTLCISFQTVHFSCMYPMPKPVFPFDGNCYLSMYHNQYMDPCKRIYNSYCSSFLCHIATSK